MSSIINISSENVTGNCDLKCNYSLNYSTSNCVAQNNGFYIQLSYDATKMPPVTYNNNKYNVQDVTIFSPSIHQFNGSLSPAEIVISHFPVSGGVPMNVAIPIIQSGDSTTASGILQQIINGVSTGAPSQGETTNLNNITNFNLENIVPLKPYYSYNDTKNDWIVYGNENAISLNQQTLTTLSQIIQPLPNVMCPSGPLIFYNNSGPSKKASNEGIYIDCKPTGFSEEETYITENKSTIKNDLFSGDYSYILNILLYCISFIITVACIYYGFKYFTKAHVHNVNFSIR